MRLGEIRKLVDGTADAAFALSPSGQIIAWNRAAEAFFGLNEKDVVGQTCQEILQGVDECGRICDEDCEIRRCAKNRQPLKSYDIQVRVNGKMQWCEFSVLIVDEAKSIAPYTIHIARPADLRKRFETLMRDFVINETNLPTVNVHEILSAKRTPTALTDLSKRETEILRLLAKGESTAKISQKLFISRTTTNNHIQHILQKLAAHSRLEAVRRAEQIGLI